MNSVEPIKNMNTVMDIAEYLRSSKCRYAERNYMLWLTGVYLGLRISDILTLKVRDVRDRESIYIREKKTGKENYVSIPKEFRPELREYIRGKKDYEYLFSSKKYEKKIAEHGETIRISKPISRQQADRVIKHAAKQFGIYRVATHSMRKTFGYFLYQRTKDIVLVKETLNHSDISITRRYIGLTQESKEEAIKDLSYRRK